MVGGRSDPGGSGKPHLTGANVLVGVPIVADRAGGGANADAARSGVQATERHVHRREITNVPAAGLRHCAVGHRDGASLRLDLDGRAAGRQVAGGGLRDIAQAAEAQRTARGLDRGVHREGAARAERLQQDVATALRSDRLADRQDAGQRAVDDAAVASRGR